MIRRDAFDQDIVIGDDDVIQPGVDRRLRDLGVIAFAIAIRGVHVHITDGFEQRHYPPPALKVSLILQKMEEIVR
jgi:hypothetical protein